MSGWEDSPIIQPAAQQQASWESAPIVQPAQGSNGHGVWDALVSGYQNSATGLAIRGKLPDVQLDPSHATWYQKAAQGIASTAFDLPEIAIGGAGGAALGTAAAPGVGTVLGGGAGAMAVPAAIRESLIQAYQSGDASSSGDFLSRAAIVLKETGKAALIGAVTAGLAGKAGQIAGGAFAPAAADTFGVSAARGAGGIAGQVLAPAALEGKLPEPQDFINAAIVVGGMHIAGSIAGKMGQIYAQTGRSPEQIVADAHTDPTIALDLKPVEAPSTSNEMLTVYHGSPHEFEQFDSGKIGSGEGAQAFGNGLYFAENPEIASNYQSSVSEKHFIEKVKDSYDQGYGPYEAESSLFSNGDLNKYERNVLENLKKDGWLGFDYPHQALQAALREPDNYDLSPESLAALKGFGNLYKVQIPQNVVDNMLHWDRPLSEQSDSVRSAIAKSSGISLELQGKLIATDPDKFDKNGKSIYSQISKSKGGDTAASQFLGSFGIKGIKYLDASSRASGDGTHNFVLFDAKDARIIERNGVKVGEPDVEIPRAYQQAASQENAQRAIPDPKFLTDEQKQAFLEKPFSDYPQKPGEPKVDLYPNVNYINTSDDALSAIARATEIVGDKILQQTRGKVPFAQQETEMAQRLAEMVGANDSSLLQARQPGTGAGTTEMWIRFHLMNAAAEDFATKTKSYDKLTSSPQDGIELLAAAERISMLSANFQGATSEAGRAFQALKMIKRGMRQADAIKKLMDGTPDPSKIADAMKDVDNPVGAAAVARKITAPKPLNNWQKWGQVYRAGLLSGTKTYLVKSIGDSVALASNIADRVVASGIGILHDGDKVTPTEAIGYASGAIHGVSDALKIAASTWTKEGSSQSAANAWEGHRNVFGVDENGKPPEPGTAAAITNKVIAIPSRIMGAETEAFRTLNESGEAQALAIRQAISEKFTPGTDDFNSRVFEIRKNPSEEMQAAISKAGDDGTFTGKLGDLGQMMQKFSKNDFGQFILPFPMVPPNLVKWAVKRVPLMAHMLSDVRDDFSAGGARRDIAIARQVIGATVATVAYGAVKSGALTGGGMALSPEERNAKMDAGWQPYSIKIDGKYFSYGRFEPIAHIAQLAADAAEIHDHMAEDDKANLPAMVGAAFGNSLISQTYLSSINGLMQALQDPTRHGPMYFDNFVGSWVPAFLGQIAGASDPQARRIDSLIDELQSKIPGLRQQLLPKINKLTGEPMQNTSSLDLTPVNVSDISSDPVLQEASRLNVGVSKAPSSIQLSSANQREIGKVQLTPEQQNIFSSASGKMTHQIMSGIVGSQQWDGMPDMIKQRIFEEAIKAGNKVGRSESLTPEQRQMEVNRISEELQAKLRGE